MAKKKTKPLELSNLDPLKVVPISAIGNPHLDPCFGKAYDLSTKECKQCGDSELCATQMSKLLGTTRKQLEAKNNYKDLDILEDVEGIKKYLRNLHKKGKTRRESIKLASTHFEVPSQYLRKVYRDLFNK